MTNTTNIKHIDYLLRRYSANYTSGEYISTETRNKLRQHENYIRRKETARVFLDIIEEKITKCKLINAREQVYYILGIYQNIKELAPQTPHATEEQIILTLCYVSVNLENELIRNMNNTSLWKKNKLNYNIYNDVSRVYFNFIAYDPRARYPQITEK